MYAKSNNKKVRGHLEREKIVGNLFSYILGIWCIFDIIVRTAFEDRINQYLEYILLIQKADINRYIDIAVLVILTILIVFLQRYTNKELLILVLISIPFIIGTINSGNNQLMSMLLFIIGAKYADIEKITKMYFHILLVMIPLIIVLCIMDILPDIIIYRGGYIRHSLGFEHPNRLGMRIFQLVACFCYIKRNNKYKWFEYIIISSLALFVYRVSNSQTAFIGLIILIIMIMVGNIYDHYNIRKKRLMVIMTGISIAINCVTVVASFFNPHNNQLFNAIDKFLSHRFIYGYLMYKYYGISIWGQDVQTIIKDTKYAGVYRQWYLDNAYLSILLRFGIVVYMLFSILWIAAIIYYLSNDDYTMVIILFTYSVYGIMTTGFYMMSHNIFLLTIANQIYNKKYIVNTKKHKWVKFIFRTSYKNKKAVI